jgi:hypothetical protein
MKHPYPPYPAIERALTEVILEARSKEIRLQNVETVSCSEDWCRTLGVWFFYESDLEVEVHKKDGTNEWLKKTFVRELDAAKVNFRFSELPEISFEFDSIENVKKNYQGSYFLRMK